jgi:hypothetical protein
MDLDYSIQYKKGIHNVAADSLSRYEPHSETHAISECVPSWIQKLKEGYVDHPEDKQLLTELSISGHNSKGFTLEGVIRFKGRVWVGNNTLAQQHILQALHDSGIGRHSGITTTYIRVKTLFAWPNLKQKVHDFVQQCTTCQQAKVEHNRMPSTFTNPISSLGGGLLYQTPWLLGKMILMSRHHHEDTLVAKRGRVSGIVVS